LITRDGLALFTAFMTVERMNAHLLAVFGEIRGLRIDVHAGDLHAALGQQQYQAAADKPGPADVIRIDIFVPPPRLVCRMQNRRRFAAPRPPAREFGSCEAARHDVRCHTLWHGASGQAGVAASRNVPVGGMGRRRRQHR
jgi:hypothetical protein